VRDRIPPVTDRVLWESTDGLDVEEEGSMPRSVVGAALPLFLALAGCKEEEQDATPDDGGGDMVDAEGGPDAAGDAQSDDGLAAEEAGDAASGPADVPDEGAATEVEADGAPEEAGEADGAADDAGGRPSASVTDETWYEGSVTCSAPGIAATSPAAGVVVVALSQIPADEIQGTCAGHWVANESEMIAGPDILVLLDGPLGSTCWTACWDFEVTITGVPPGTYTVQLVGMGGLRAPVVVS
jgi:hypothetical protein